MNNIGFLRELSIGLVLAMFSGVLVFLASAFFVAWFSLNMAIGLSCFIYIFFLASRSSLKSGKLSLIVSVGIALVASFIFINSLLLFLAISGCLIWVSRNTLFFSGAFAAAGDLALVAASTLFAIWAALETHSVFIAVWCFFMALATGACLFSGLFPLQKDTSASNIAGSSNKRFQSAYNTAELALKRATTH